MEHNVDTGDRLRKNRWWKAYGSGSVTLPLVMVDSGNEISNGPVDYHAVYSSMVDTSMQRPPQAAITATATHAENNRLQFIVEVTNLSGERLSKNRNDATVHAMIYKKIP